MTTRLSGIRLCLPWGIMAVIVLAQLWAGGLTASAEENSCAACHGDRARLRQLSPRWRDVFVDPAQFAADKHASVDCSACHRNEGYAVYPHRFASTHRQDPAEVAEVRNSCGSCHEEITARHLDSLHSTLEGHRRSLVELMGEKEGMVRFRGCTSCHATCTDCHMKQPDRYGRLVPKTESHRFARRTPAAVCKVCHGQTAETYLGARGSAAHGPSVMATAGLECLDCHPGGELHGSGARPGFIGETVRPNCEKCHANGGGAVPTAKGPQTARQYDANAVAHRIHGARVACVGCHTQWYTNCWDCHKGKAKEEGDKFFLAMNPETGKVHTAIHVPIGTEFGDVSPEAGGWAVKTRHSWGKSQSCEKCHTDPAVYISTEQRRASFVSFWSRDHANAAFVAEKLVKQITIDRNALRAGPHKDVSCEGCHSEPGDQACAGCHTGKQRQLRADSQRSDELLRSAQRAFTKLDRAKQQSFEARWSQLRDRYLEAGNTFHRDPGLAQRQMRGVRQDASGFDRQLQKTLRDAR